MTDKEKLDAIRAEIHRLVDVRGYDRGMANDLLAFMDSLPNEPVSNDLEEAACEYDNSHIDDNNLAFKAGAQWQKEQMEKNRIEHCDNITEEQYNLETGFLDSFLDKNKRMPTFLDAIEYGMKKAMENKT